MNSLPTNQVLYGNNQGQLTGKDIGKYVSFKPILVSGDYIKWPTVYNNDFYGITQDDNKILGYIVIDAIFLVLKRGGAGVVIINPPTGYTVGATQQSGIAYGGGNVYIFWTEGGGNNILTYWDNFNTNIPLNTGLRVNYSFPIMLQKIN